MYHTKFLTEKKHILKNISLKITEKSRILVKGESGSGKSTLFRINSGY